MKKIILMAVVAWLVCLPCFSQENATAQKNTVEALFSNFSKEKNVTHVKLGGFIMALANKLEDTKGVTGIEVFAFDECDKQVKDRFNEAIEKLKDSSFEPFVSTTQNGEKTKVLLKIKDDFISEIVVIAGGDDPALVRIKGKIKPDDIQQVVKDNQ